MNKLSGIARRRHFCQGCFDSFSSETQCSGDFPSPPKRKPSPISTVLFAKTKHWPHPIVPGQPLCASRPDIMVVITFKPRCQNVESQKLVEVSEHSWVVASTPIFRSIISPLSLYFSGPRHISYTNTAIYKPLALNHAPRPNSLFHAWNHHSNIEPESDRTMRS